LPFIFRPPFIFLKTIQLKIFFIYQQVHPLPAASYPALNKKSG